MSGGRIVEKKERQCRTRASICERCCSAKSNTLSTETFGYLVLLSLESSSIDRIHCVPYNEFEAASSYNATATMMHNRM